MLLTDRQLEKYIAWFKENYWQYCENENGRLWIPVIYCDNPREEEEKHRQIWLEEIKKLMWKNADKTYVHRWGREESYAEAQFNSLWLYHSPIFKSNEEKDAIN